MSIDILKMLIKSACSEGEIMEDDKILLRKKASDLGINEAGLNKMIEAELKGETYEPVVDKVKEKKELVLKVQADEPTIVIKDEKPTMENKPEIKTVEEELVIEEEIIIPGVLKETVNKEKPVEKEIKEVKQPEIKKEKIVEPVTLEKTTEPDVKIKEKVIADDKKVKRADPEPKPEPSGKRKIVPFIIGGVILVVIIFGFIFKDKIFGGSDGMADNSSDNTENVVNKEEMYKKFMEKGKTAFAGQEYLSSKNNFDSALVYKPGDKDATEWVEKLQMIIPLLNEANELFKNKNIARAKVRYDSLLTIAADEKTATENIVKCNEIIDKAKNLSPEKSESEEKFGYSDPDGNIVIDYIFKNAKKFYGKMAPVQNSAGKWGLIGEDYHKTHKNVVDFKYDKIRIQKPGYACRITGDPYYYAFFYKNGKLVERKF